MGPVQGQAGVLPLGEVLVRRHLPALDGLRACSVAVVMLYHYGYSKVPGDLGVSSFFVLSGFLITWLLLKEFDRSRTVSLRDFYLRRVLRIFPAYYVFLAVSLGFDFVRGDPRARELVLPAVAYMMNYYNALNGHPPTSIAHTWSLGIEEQFYLVWPALFLLVVSRRTWRPTALILLAIVGLAGWRAYRFLTGRAGEAYVYNAFETRADILAIGCLLALAGRHVTVQRQLGRLAAHPMLPLATLALLLWSRVSGPKAYHYSIGFTVDGILVAVLIVQVLMLSATPMWRWLDHRVVRFFGAISYPLYLYHGWGYSAARKLAAGEPLLVKALVAACVSMVLAMLSYYLVERPFIAMKAKFGGSSDRVPDAVANAARR